MTKKNVTPFPSNFARSVDLIPVLSLQKKVNDKEKISYFKGYVSVSSKRPVIGGILGETLGDLKINVHESLTDGHTFEMEWGNPDPTAKIEQQVPPTEIVQSIQEIGDIGAEMVFKQRTTVNIPPDIPEMSNWGADFLLNIQQGYGYRRHIGTIPCFSVAKAMKDKLQDVGMIRKGDLSIKHLKSVLLTDRIMPSDGHECVINKDVAHIVQDIMQRPKFWQDIAFPAKLRLTMNGASANGHLLWLEKRKERLGLPTYNWSPTPFSG